MSRSRRYGDERSSRPKHRRERAEDAFRCAHCRLMVSAFAPGTRHRTHCPSCLWSRHVDETTGDRRAVCGAAMEPIAIWVQPRGEWSLVHRCTSCGSLRCNRIAADDNEFALASLAARPVARPAFPLEGLGPRRGSDGRLRGAKSPQDGP